MKFATSSAKSGTKNAVAVEVSCKVVMASARTAECTECKT